MKSLSTEGRKDLEGKKELIDRNIETIGKTLMEVQRRIEEVGKTSGEKITEVATLIKKHEEVTTKLKDRRNTWARLGEFEETWGMG
jgi:chaperonin cofactor prefoldin